MKYHIPDSTIQPLREGLAVLKLLLSAIHPMSAGQIAQAVGVEYSHAQRLLYTLEIEHMAERNEQGLWDIHADGLWSAFDIQEGT